MYDPAIVEPMRQELTSAGVIEMRSSEEVEKELENFDSTVLVVVNSVCGCAAGGLRPGVRIALESDKLPEKITTVFAGQDKEATAKARSYFHGFPASSPSIALLKGGQVAHFVSRQDIEGKTPEQIAEGLITAFNSNC